MLVAGGPPAALAGAGLAVSSSPGAIAPAMSGSVRYTTKVDLHYGNATQHLVHVSKATAIEPLVAMTAYQAHSKFQRQITYLSASEQASACISWPFVPVFHSVCFFLEIPTPAQPCKEGRKSVFSGKVFVFISILPQSVYLLTRLLTPLRCHDNDDDDGLIISGTGPNVGLHDFV